MGLQTITPKQKALICLLDTVGCTRQRTGFPSLSLLDKDRPRLSRNIVLCIDIQCHAHPYVACKITETSTKRHDQSKHNSHCLYYRISRYFSEDLILTLIARFYISLKLCIANNTSHLDIMQFINFTLATILLSLQFL